MKKFIANIVLPLQIPKLHQIQFKKRFHVHHQVITRQLGSHKSHYITTIENGWISIFNEKQKLIDNASSYLNDLSDEQYKAATAKNQVVSIIAGPGSGKTRVLISRVAYLISQYVKPSEILILTFTNKAAKELKDRLNMIFGNEFEASIKVIKSGTFHSIGCQFLREYISLLKCGRNSNFSIYDEDQSFKIIKEICENKILNNEILKNSNDLKEAKLIRQRYIRESRRLADEMARKIALFKDSVPTAFKLNSRDFSDFRTKKFKERNPEHCEIFDQYQSKLKLFNAVDFSDLIGLTIALFKYVPNVLAEIQYRYKHVLVDEMQDTNLQQYEFLKLIFNKNNSLFVVGDPNQAIYYFRGAQMENIVNKMHDDFENYTIKYLNDNYRSVSDILEFSKLILMNNLNTNLTSKRKEKGFVIIKKLLSAPEEAKYVINESCHLNKLKGIPFSEMAILYRKNSLSRIIEQECIEQNVPVAVSQNKRFWKKRDVNEIFSYLKFILNPKDKLAFETIINVPKRGIGKINLNKIKEWLGDRASGYPMSLVIKEKDEIELMCKELKLSKKVKSGLESFRNLFLNLNESVINTAISPSELIDKLIELTDYEAHLLKQNNDRKLKANDNNILDNIKIMKQVTLENKEITRGQQGLQEYINLISLWTSDDIYDKDGLQLMSIHMAKGLEFKVVFIIACEEEILPMTQKDSLKDEEVRIAFVACTRAKDYLYLTHVDQRSELGQKLQKQVPSRFITGFVKDSNHLLNNCQI